jgi:ParB-like chromosome segregation protein Spo0J
VKTHPLADVFPMMDPASLVQLRSDIKKNGVREPIWVYDGQILDGRHRWMVCKDIGIECPTRQYEGTDPFGFVVSMNLRRRHLDSSQRAMVAAELVKIAAKGRPKKNGSTDPFTQPRAAKVMEVSTPQVKRAQAVLKHAPASVVDAVKSGELSVRKAAAQVQDIRRRNDAASRHRLALAVEESADTHSELRKGKQQAARRQANSTTQAAAAWRDVYWSFEHALEAIAKARSHTCPKEQFVELQEQVRQIAGAINAHEGKVYGHVDHRVA